MSAPELVILLGLGVVCLLAIGVGVGFLVAIRYMRSPRRAVRSSHTPGFRRDFGEYGLDDVAVRADVEPEPRRSAHDVRGL